MPDYMGIPDNGFRSKCCLAPVMVGQKKLKKAGKITVWVCCRCKTKDVPLLSIDEANEAKKQDYLRMEISDDNHFSD